MSLAVDGRIESVRSAKDIITDVVAQIEAASKNTGAFSGVPSGFKDIDRITSGWQPSELIVIAARPSMGKTAFVLSMVCNMAFDLGAPVAFFSLEMSSAQLMMRLLVADTGLSSTDIKSGRLTPEQWRRISETISYIEYAPLYIDDTPALSVSEFCSRARLLKEKYGVKVFVIDYLQLMTGNQSPNGNREQEIDCISRTLKAVARELDVSVIVLSQLNRSIEMRGEWRCPRLSDLCGSGSIEQNADIVIFIHRLEYYGINTDENGMPTAGMAEIILAKHRNGAVADVKLRFLKDRARFVDMDAEVSGGFAGCFDGPQLY